jgi:hypothetical protein
MKEKEMIFPIWIFGICTVEIPIRLIAQPQVPPL